MNPAQPQLLSIQEAARVLKVSTKTLRRWEKSGTLIPAQRTEGNQRRYSPEQLSNFQKPSFLSTSPLTSPFDPEATRTVASQFIPRANNFSPADFLAPVQRIALGSLAIVLVLFGSGFAVVKSPQITQGINHLAAVLGFSANKADQAQEGIAGNLGTILGSTTSLEELLFNVNVGANFAQDVTIEGDLTAPNIVYEITAGTGITVTGDAQNPTISATDTSSDLRIFKTVKVGSTEISAGSKTDTLTLAAGDNITLSTDTDNKKITIKASSTDVTTSGWTDDGTILRLTTAGDIVSIGSATGAAKLAIENNTSRDLFTASQSGNLVAKLDANGLLNLSTTGFSAGLKLQNNSTMFSGTGAPSDSNGSDGDYYFRTDGTGGSTSLYYKVSGAWVSAGGGSLQTAYDTDTDGSNAIIALTTADDSLIFRNPASGGTDSSFVLSLQQLSSGSTSILNFSNSGTGADITSDADLTINPTGGQVILADTDTINIGGLTNVAYNALANASDAPDEAAIAADNDLYIGGDLEVDGTIYGSVSGTISPGFTEGSVVFINSSGALAQDNTNFFWDDGNNRLGLGDNSPDYSFEISDTTNTPVLALSDDDIAHGVTDVVQTDVFAHLTSISTTVGGLRLNALADADGQAMELRGIQAADPTDTTPAVKIVGAKASGTSVVDLGAAETVFQVANNDDTAALTILGSGDLAIGGVTSEAPAYFDISASALNFNPFGASSGNTGEIRFQELEANGDHYTGLKAPDSLTANVIYTLPTADATSANQILASNAAGVLSWIDVSAGAGNLWSRSGSTLQPVNSGDGAAIGDLTLGLNDTSATLTSQDTNENLTIDPNGSGDVYFHGSTYQISDTGDLTLGGRIIFENAEYIANETDDIIAFVGSGGTDDTDLYLSLDGAYPLLYSNADTIVGFNDSIVVTGQSDLEGYASIGNGSALDADETLIVNRAFTGTAGNSIYQVHVGGNITENTSGTHTTIAPLAIDAITVTNGGGTEVVTNLASLYIAGAPTAGTTPTNGPYAVFVDAGSVRFDGATVLNTVSYTWPSADATAANQILASNAAGVLSWIDGDAAANGHWSDSGVIVYLTDTTDDVAIGGSDSDSEFYFDTSDSAFNLNPYGTSTGNTGSIRFQELEANGDNYTGFKAPDSLTGNVTYTLPSADGAANQVLATNSTGTLSWIDVSAGAGSLWSQTSGVLYPTTGTDDLAIGGNDSTADFFVADNGKTTYNVSTTGTYIDFVLETEWTTGDLINADYASATTLTGDVVGFDLNINTNVTGVADGDVTGFYAQTPALTSSGATTTNYYGFRTGGGALDTTASGGATTDVNWYGTYIQIPNVDTGEAGDTTNAYGLAIFPGTVTNGAGTENEWGILVDASSGDIVGGDASGDDLLLISTTNSTKGDIQFHSTSYYVNSTGDFVVGGRVTFENSEYIANETDDLIVFAGAGGADNTDLYIDLDGTYPVLYSNTDTTIGITDDLDVTTVATSGTGINLTANTVTSGTALALSATAKTTGDIFDITGTYAPTDGSTNSAIDINLTNNPSSSANTLRGLDLAITDGDDLANTLYGVYGTVNNSTNTSSGTHSIYGGYFTATGKTTGTTTAIGLYASASGADSNYAGIFESGYVGVGITTPAGRLTVSNDGQSGTPGFVPNIFLTGTDDPRLLFEDKDGGVMEIAQDGSSSLFGFETAFHLKGGINFSGGVISTGTAYLSAINSTGNIGLSSSAPDARLEINHATGDILRMTYNDSDGSATAYTDFSLDSAGDLTLDSAGGNIQFADTDTLIIGGHAGDVAYNVISNAGGSPGDASVDADNDLYIQGSLEIDGTLIAGSTLSCTDCIDWDDIVDSMTLDAATTITTTETTATAITLTGTSFTTGEIFDITGTWAPTDGSTNEAIDINLTHTPTSSADNFRGIDLDLSDGTALGNTIYNYDGTLTLTGNAAKTGIGLYQSVTSSSTTGDTLIAFDASTTVTGIIGGATTRNVYGLRSLPTAGAESTAGTTNVYGAYINATGDVGAGGTFNAYGAYIANGTYDTDGTSTAIGLYVEAISGADTNYAAIFAGGNVGIGDTTPDALLEVLGTTEQLRLTYTDNTVDSRFTVDSAGDLTINNTGTQTIIADDLQVQGGDITTNQTTATVFNTTATTLSIGGAATTFNLGTTDSVTRTINLGTGTGADTINIGTGATTADTLNFGNTGVATTFNFDTGAATVDAFDVQLNSLTTGLGFDLDANALTSGTVFDLASTSTALTSGRLINLDWSPGSSTTATGDLFRLNIGTNGTTTGNLFDIEDASSSIFSVSETAVTSALPAAFNAAGDVSIAYDILFTNQTASYLKSNAPLYIEAGESFENNNLTLKTYGTGQIVTEGSFNGTNITSRDDETGASTNTITGRGMVYYLHADSNTTNSSFTTDYNITGVPDIYGTVVLINSVAEKGATAGSVAHTVEININGTQVSSVATATGTGASTVKESYVIVRSYDGWKIVGSTGTSDSADYAEVYKAADNVESAEVVALTPNDVLKVERATTGTLNRVIGVTSTSPAYLIGEQFDSSTKTLPVALSGRVPVKVSQASAPMQIGDTLTASSEPGKATKATQPGRTIGRALEPWTPGQQTVLMFIENTWSDPRQFLAFDGNGNLTIKGSLTAQNVVVKDNPQNPLEPEIINLRSNIQDLTSDIASISAQIADLRSQILVDSNPAASLSAELWAIATESGKLTTIYELQTPSITVLGPLHVGLLTIDDLTSTISSLLGTVTIDGDLAVTGSLKVLGQSAGITTITAGQTEILVSNDLASSTSAIFVTPKSQAIPVASEPASQSGQFKIKIPTPLLTDLEVQWWIVN